MIIIHIFHYTMSISLIHNTYSSVCVCVALPFCIYIYIYSPVFVFVCVCVCNFLRYSNYGFWKSGINPETGS